MTALNSRDKPTARDSTAPFRQPALSIAEPASSQLKSKEINRNQSQEVFGKRLRFLRVFWLYIGARDGCCETVCRIVVYDGVSG
jgi:hypothetical protein